MFLLLEGSTQKWLWIDRKDGVRILSFQLSDECSWNQDLIWLVKVMPIMGSWLGFQILVAVDEVPAIEHFLGDCVCTVSFKLLER